MQLAADAAPKPPTSTRFPSQPFSTPCLVHTTSSTSVSTRCTHRKRLHRLCGVCVCMTRRVRGRIWARAGASNKICVYLSGSTGLCLLIKQSECLLYFMYERDNLAKGSKGEIFWFEACDASEWVVTRSPFGSPPHQNKPCEQCLLGKRFVTAEAVICSICHLQSTCHTQTHTDLSRVSSRLVKVASACKCFLFALLSLNLTHIVVLT